MGLCFLCLQRRKLRKRDDFPDRFDRNSFIRASIALPNDPHSPDNAIGSRNAVALAKANMGYNDNAEMSESKNWGSSGAAGGATAGYYDAYPAQNQAYAHQQQQDYGYSNGYNQSSNGHYNDYDHRQPAPAPSSNQYAELSRQLDIPAVAVASPPHSPHDYPAHQGYAGVAGGRVSPPQQGRQLTVNTQGGYRGQDYYDDGRTGTPVDANPQMIYHQGSRNGQQNGRVQGGHHQQQQHQEYDDDPYGGM